jgi:L-seryl-tRNA(Ser) seleniumtransferase
MSQVRGQEDATLPYERGQLLAGTEDDYAKLRHGWSLIRARIESGRPVFNFTGLERSLSLDSVDSSLLDDELAPALFADRLTELALEHLGGNPNEHDVLVTNRLTAAIFAAVQVMAHPGTTVVGVSAGYSHPSVVRAVHYAGARFVDVNRVDDLLRALEEFDDVSLIVLTRLAVTYEALAADELTAVVAAAHARGVPVLVDDAGGARVGPAVLGQPKTLELGVDLGATGLDKYGTTGPRLGLLAGSSLLVAPIRARAIELGMEARPMLYPAVVRSLESYRPERVRELVETTKRVGEAVRARLGDLVHETPVTVQLRGADMLAAASAHAGVGDPPLVPVEATAALAMLLLRDHGVVTVHFAALPPGTPDLLIKFVPPDTLAEFGGADAFADAVADAFAKLIALVGDAVALRSLLFGDA